MDYKQICFAAKQEIITVGSFIKESRQSLSSNQIEVKGKNDFVTTIDKKSEEKLVTALQNIVPEAGFIVEEQTSNKRGNTFNWIIDPIDGTTNFIHGLFPYAISVALQENSETVIGIVYEIGLDECFYSWKGGSAFLNNTLIKVSETANINASLIATGFPYNDLSRVENFQKTLTHFMQNSHGIRRLGSAATDLAYVACGRFDAFYEYSLKPWDVAAGAFLVQQAGGVISDFSGNNDYIFGGEIIACNKLTFNEFLSIIKELM